MEWVEGAMGTTMLLVDLVHITCLGDTYRLLTALQARLLRQQDKQVVTQVESEYLEVDSIEIARAISTVMQHSQSVTLYRTEHRPQLNIEADIGEDEWKALAKAISGKGVGGLRCNSSYLGSARREDLKIIWESGA